MTQKYRKAGICRTRGVAKKALFILRFFLGPLNFLDRLNCLGRLYFLGRLNFLSRLNFLGRLNLLGCLIFFGHLNYLGCPYFLGRLNFLGCSAELLAVHISFLIRACS